MVLEVTVLDSEVKEGSDTEVGAPGTEIESEVVTDSKFATDVGMIGSGDEEIVLVAWRVGSEDAVGIVAGE